jgi:subtilisin family serine protease
MSGLHHIPPRHSAAPAAPAPAQEHVHLDGVPIVGAERANAESSYEAFHRTGTRLEPVPLSIAGLRITHFTLEPKASISVSAALGRCQAGLPRPAAAAAYGCEPGEDADDCCDLIASVLIKTNDPRETDRVLAARSPAESVRYLTSGFYSARLGKQVLRRLLHSSATVRVTSKKQVLPRLNRVLPCIGAVDGGGVRLVEEDGRGVLIGIVDSGFDLSHPMFRDAKNRLRVEALHDQFTGETYDQEKLEELWRSGDGPGADPLGHGTHVASICGGSPFCGLEGVAPGARFLLVKGNRYDTVDGVSWIFQRAGNRPCVINLSLGHHFGAHDGTSFEEQIYDALSEPGHVVVVAAGNEQDDRIHIGGDFHRGRIEEIPFDVLRPEERLPYAVLTLWHAPEDQFHIELIRPDGRVAADVLDDHLRNAANSRVDIETARIPYPDGHAVQTQITLSFQADARDSELQRWKLRVVCLNAVFGRLDGWFHNPGFATFAEHSLVQRSGTIGLPATARRCLAVGSHVTRADWEADMGSTADHRAVPGRISAFSSLGPTRDGRWKPDVSAPGQYITAALARSSRYSRWDERTLGDRLLTIEGTSMAAPVVTGIVAVLLQRKSTLNYEQLRQVLGKTARHDAHNGPARWNPAYGYGKVDLQAALAQL